MPSKKKTITISYPLGDQTYNKDYPKILLEFADGIRTIDNPIFVESLKRLNGHNYKDILLFCSAANPVRSFMMAYRLSINTIHKYISDHPAFKKAFMEAHEKSLLYTHLGHAGGAITDKQYAVYLRMNHGFTLSAPVQPQPSLPPPPQQITVQNSWFFLDFSCLFAILI